MDKGELKEFGTHNQLLAEDGFYAKLVKGQMSAAGAAEGEEEAGENGGESNQYLLGIAAKDINVSTQKPRKGSE